MRSRGFTLIELLVIMTTLAVLVALDFPAISKGTEYAHKTRCLSNMRQIGIGIHLFAQDNDNQIPSRGVGNDSVTGQPNDKWPAAVSYYLKDARVFMDPDDPESVASTSAELISNNGNRTAFLMNGFNDLGAYDNPNFTLSMSRLKNPAGTILLGKKKAMSRQYYMDFVEGPNGNQNDVLDKIAFGSGSTYVFADGSARFLDETEYNDEMWVISAGYIIPTP